MSVKLRRINRILRTTNERLREANAIRENFLVNYMIKCVGYIKTVDERTSGFKAMLKGGGAEALAAEFRKPRFSDKELKAFYSEFDKTFLAIFPSFMSAVGAGEWQLDRNGGLPMELRILAVMRIGILNSKDIAAFLNFPPASIYTYRHTLKSRLNLSDKTLEEFVAEMNI